MKLLTALILAGCAAVAQAQSSCSSDGLPAPTALAERFISADCEDCWSAPDAQQQVVGTHTLVLDWIVPSDKGDDAPLSAAATRDALERLQMLRAATPLSWVLQGQTVTANNPKTVRVAHGPALANYMGASIELTPPNGGPWTAVLLLVEQIPAGIDGTPIARNLVRNMLVTSWDPAQLPPSEPLRLHESRPMSLPAGTQAQRVQAVGWVQDAKGKRVALAQSACQVTTEN
jgi:hypothetical protein